MLCYPLGFESTIPAKLGLPLLPNNIAEGIVVKPLHTAVLECKKGMERVIFKRKVEGFAEKKRRWKVPKVKQGFPNDADEYQLLKYEMLALVTEQRLVNTISKLGQPETDESTGPSWQEIQSALITDIIAELKTDEELWGKFIRMSKQFKGMLMTEIKDDCNTTIEEYKGTHT